MRSAIKGWWRKYFASVGWPLNTACFVAILIILLHDFIFAGWPELFPRAAQLWKLAYQLSLALVASYVFFYINVHLRNVREKETLRPFLYRYTLYIVGDAQAIILALKQATNEPVNSEAANTDFDGEWPSLEEVRRMCQAINPHTQPPQFVGDWFQFLGSRWERTMHYISRIYTATRFLEPKHQHLVMELENCFYFRTLRTKIALRASFTDMSVWARELHDYFQKARSLQRYADANLTASGKWEPL